jgi:hypothetical protein
MVPPSAKELQFIVSIVGFGAGGNMSETTKQVRKRMARVLMIFPPHLPRKKGGGWARVP